MYSQTYVGVYGGVNENTIGVKANIIQEFDHNLGGRFNFYYSDHRGKDIFSSQVSYTFNRKSFYTPVVSSGAEFNDGIKPLLSLENRFRVEDYFDISLGTDTNLDSWYFNLGVVVRFKLVGDKEFRPRFF